MKLKTRIALSLILSNNRKNSHKLNLAVIINKSFLKPTNKLPTIMCQRIMFSISFKITVYLKGQAKEHNPRLLKTNLEESYQSNRILANSLFQITSKV